MMPGYWPVPSGHTAKVGIWPYLVVTTTSFSSIARILRFGKVVAPEPRAIAPRCLARRAEHPERVRQGVGGRREALAQPRQAVQVGQPALDKGPRIGELRRAVVEPVQHRRR